MRLDKMVDKALGEVVWICCAFSLPWVPSNIDQLDECGGLWVRREWFGCVRAGARGRGG